MKEKDKLIIVGDSIVSGLNETVVSTEKLETIVRYILGATTQGMVHHAMLFLLLIKIPKFLSFMSKLIILQTI